MNEPDFDASDWGFIVLILILLAMLFAGGLGACLAGVH